MSDDETKTEMNTADVVVDLKYEKFEKLRKERTNLRRLFTTTCNQFEKGRQGKELGVIFNKLSDKAERLFVADAQILELVDQSDKEYDEMESYRDRFIEIKTEYEHYLLQSNSEATPTDMTASNGKLRLPKIELKEYDLMPRTWVAFWAQYSRIHEDSNIREEDKFQYLLSSLKPISKARSIVESYPPSKNNYQKVIEHLESRFGRRDLLIDVFIRDLLTLVNNRANIKLSDLYDKLGTSLRALETLGVTTQNYAAMLYPVVESCLPSDVLKAWDRYSLSSELDDEETKETIQITKEKLLERLMSFLRREVEGEEHRALAEKAFGHPTKGKRESPNKDEATAMALTTSSEKSSKIECIFCQKRHASQDCYKAASMNIEERKSIVIRKHCCLVCLKAGHLAKNCRSGIHCLMCGKRHYVILCPELPKENKVQVTDESKMERNTSTFFTELTPQKVIYLKTLFLRLRNGNQEHYVRALLDDGSQRSYVTKHVVKELRLTPSGTELLSQGLFGGKQTTEVRHGRYDINVQSMDRRFSYKISALDQPKICSSLPRIRDQDLIHELKIRGIELTDVGPETPPIDMLIGADFLGGILTGKIEVLPSGITAIETKLGWSVLGQGKRSSINMVSLCMYHSEIHKIWDIESLGITDPTERKTTKELDEETVAFFQETIRKTGDRYEVALPWLAGHPPLYEGYDQAEARLRTVTKRLLKDNNYELYDDVLQQWKNDKIIEEVTEIEMSSSKACHYLPHHPVIKLSSSTTKIRPVFDASYKRPGYASLNDCLSTGPSLLHQIPHLISKFRWDAIGVTADIKQAFLQLSLVPEDRDYLRFLWWEDKKHTKLKFFRHCRVVFGVSSSPFLLNATILQHLGQDKFQVEELEFTRRKLQDGFYVDNLVTSVQNEEQYQFLKRQAIEIMAKGCFDLRCWFSTGSSEKSIQSVLGLKWNCETDEMSCVFTKPATDQSLLPTKRIVLSIVNSIYDPIGFSCPAMLHPKLVLQEAWKRKLSWDEELPEDLKVKFNSWARHLGLIEHCSIPRRMFRGILDDATLHLFSDASGLAYACCAFIRCKDQDEVFVNLVAAKSRVLPINRPTIP